MSGIKQFIDEWIVDFFRFSAVFIRHIFKRYLTPSFYHFESIKSIAVVVMYRQRGKYAQVFVNGALLLVMVLGVSVGPSLIVDNGQMQVALTDSGSRVVFAAGPAEGQQILGAQEAQVEIQPFTQYSDKPRAEITEYTIEAGDTLSTVANKFGVSLDTIIWANPNKLKNEKSKIKPGDVLQIPPVTGVVHVVKSGETIYSIAKKYSADAQTIVDYSFNTFTNDETFALAIGQQLVVPDGVMPDVKPVSPTTPLARVMTPDAGAVSATGSWLWPASGRLTQGYKSWHKAIDIANQGGGPIVAADSGVVIVSGWVDNTGYGNRVVIDHGNGFKTLYAHLSRVAVQTGQRVNRGDKLGDMGSTGRSTGTHLHFEIRTSSGNANPSTYLK